MLQRNYLKIWIGLAFCMILIFGFLLTEFKLNLYFNSGTLKFVQIVLIACVGLFVKRTINLILTTSSYGSHHINSSPLFIHLINFLIILGTFLTIFLFALKQNFSDILTAGTIISASLVFALKSIIMDAASGFILDADHRFKIGDWIEGRGKKRGQIIKVTWRTTILQNEYGYHYHVPNGDLIRNGYMFIPEYCVDILKVEISQKIPFERVDRILTSALMTLPETRYQYNQVLAHNMDDDNIVYEVSFGVEHYTQRELIRHKVLQSLAHYLSLYDLKNSEDNMPEKILKMVDIFQPLSPESLSKLASSMTQKSYAQGAIIVQQGSQESSMYLIYEGAATVEANKDNETDAKDIATLGPGQFFGDIALLMGQARTATVRALTDMILFEIKKEDLQPIFYENPDVVESLSQIIAERLSGKEKILQNASMPQEKLSQKTIILNEIKNFFSLL
ncbi:MAG: mechanosensitive ion channel family protein [Janthinobacterium lividum]